MKTTDEAIQKNRARLAPHDLNRAVELYQIEREAIARFHGQIDELEAALGVLHLGDHIGWKPLVLIHNKRTIRKYEEILGIQVRAFFCEEGPSAERSIGYKIAKKLGAFWKAVSGDLDDPELKANRRSVA